MTRAPQVRFDLILPPDMQMGAGDNGAISPDGRWFVFTAIVGGRRQLVLRDLASTDLSVLGGTEGAYAPFWAPDSQAAAFFVGEQLRSVRVTGGSSRVLADVGHATVPVYSDGTWAPGVVLIARDRRIYRLADTGGTAVDAFPHAPKRQQFFTPRFLPDGRHFLVSIEDPATPSESGLYVASIDTLASRKISADILAASYAAGYLFYQRGTGVFARPFDPARLEFSGPEAQVIAERRPFSVSENGTIAYRHPLSSTLTWLDRGGRRVGTLGEAGPYLEVVLSPRGRRATVLRYDVRRNGDLWDVDLASAIFSRLTTDPAYDGDPSWSPDERTLAFTSARTGRFTPFVKDAASGKEEPLGTFGEDANVDGWTPDGQFVIVRTLGKAVYAVPFTGDRTPRLLADTPYVEDESHVSPDGRWIAFNADESGRWEVYVAPFPAFTSKRQVSSDGGVQPQWRADGRELFYLARDGSMMSVRVDTRTELTATTPARLFPTDISPDASLPQYGVTADGQRFLGLERVGGGARFTFLLNWLGQSGNSRAVP